MPDVPKHAWTHRPRAQGGTDPIEFPAGSDLTWAMASASTQAIPSVGGGTYYQFGFDFAYTNDSSGFGTANVTDGRAQFLQVNTPGYYVMRARIFKGSPFDNTNDTWIDPTFDVAGELQALQVNLDVEDFIGSYWAAPSLVNSGGPAWYSLYTELAFNWDPATGGTDLKDQDPLLVGLTLAQAGGPLTLSMAGDIHLTRIASPGYTDISP